MAKKATTSYEIISYDVWGNEKDGWEVNQSFNTGTFVELPENPNERQIIAALKAADYVNKYAKMAAFSWDYNNSVCSHDIYIELANGRPFCELRKDMTDIGNVAKVMAELKASKDLDNQE